MLVGLFLTTILHVDYQSTLIDHVSSRLQSIIDRALLTSQILPPKALTYIADFYSRFTYKFQQYLNSSNALFFQGVCGSKFCETRKF